MSKYAFWSYRPQLRSPEGEELRGVPCEHHRASRTHYVYLLALDENQLASIRASPMHPMYLGQKHFGELRLSRNPKCFALIGGMSVYPKLAQDDGPTRVGRPTRAVRAPAWLPVHACPEHRRFVAELIVDIAARARVNPSLRSASRLMLHSLLWHWTADGVPEGSSELDWRGRDRLKYDFQRLAHTREAHDKSTKTGKKGLVHEHIVPRHLIVERLLDQPPRDAEAIVEFLQKYCRGAIVTKDQDRELHRDAMPPDKSAPHTPWSFDGPYDDPYARYEGAGFVLHRNKREGASGCHYCGLEEST